MTLFKNEVALMRVFKVKGLYRALPAEPEEKGEKKGEGEKKVIVYVHGDDGALLTTVLAPYSAKKIAKGKIEWLREAP